MEYVRLGKTGLLVSEICLGTMTFGNEADEETSQSLMAAALDKGINFFDAAHNYNLGRTEEIVGRWLEPHRDELIITSKVYFPFGGPFPLIIGLQHSIRYRIHAISSLLTGNIEQAITCCL